MNMIEIQGSKYTGATTWNEFSTEQLLLISKLLSQNLTARDLKKRIAWSFLKIPFRIYKKLNSLQRIQVEDTFNFIFSVDKSFLTKWALPEINMYGTRYYGPSDSMLNSTVAEFIEAERYMNDWHKSNQTIDLAKMVACFYRTGNEKNRDTTGDIREPFNGYVIQWLANDFSKLPAHQLQLILLNFKGVRKLMEQKHPHVFVRNVNSRNRNFGWAGIIVDLAGDKFGTDDEVQKKLIWNILFVLEKNEVQRIEAESQKPKAA